MIVKLTYLIASVSWLLFSCHQEDLANPDPNKNVYKDPAQFGVPFTKVADPENIIMYEVNIRAFSQSGDFEGVKNRLDYIKSLGVNTIWLMPIFPVGQVKSAGGLGSPYAVKNYVEVNSEFGDLDDLRDLVEKAHEKDMSVILDWVANHTAWDNPWIKNKSWYTQNASGEITIPAGTNWLDVADLNYENKDMRVEMIRAMKYWVLAANIDGYRCDAVDFVPVDFWKQAIDTLKNIGGRKLIYLAEGGRPDNFSAGFQMNYSWDFYNNLKEVYEKGASASSVHTTHLKEYSTIPANGVKLRYTTNHDESAWEKTPIELFNGKDGAFSASVVTIFLGGSPLIYGSQEVGQHAKLPFFTRSPINWSDNPEMFENYQEIMQVYTGTETFQKGELEYFNHDDVVAFKRIHQQSEYLIIVNVRSAEVNYPVAEGFKNTSWVSAMDGNVVEIGSSLILQPYNYLILKKP